MFMVFLFVGSASLVLGEGVGVCDFLPGAACSGADIRDAGVVSSEDECCDKCATTDGCRAWTWNKHIDQHCWVKTECAGMYDRSSVISGTFDPPECSLLSGQACNGDDIADAGVVASEEECCEQCGKTSGCGAWTWNKQIDQHCWLKYDCVDVYSRSSVTSGTFPRRRRITPSPSPRRRRSAPSPGPSLTGKPYSINTMWEATVNWAGDISCSDPSWTYTSSQGEVFGAYAEPPQVAVMCDSSGKLAGVKGDGSSKGHWYCGSHVPFRADNGNWYGFVGVEQKHFASHGDTNWYAGCGECWQVDIYNQGIETAGLDKHGEAPNADFVPSNDKYTGTMTTLYLQSMETGQRCYASSGIRENDHGGYKCGQDGFDLVEPEDDPDSVAHGHICEGFEDEKVQRQCKAWGTDFLRKVVSTDGNGMVKDVTLISCEDHPDLYCRSGLIPEGSNCDSYTGGGIARPSEQKVAI